MKASFMVSPTSELFQAKLAAQSHLVLLPYLPRAKRKALRVTTPKAVPTPDHTNQQALDQVITDWLAVHDPMNESHYYNANTVDPDMDITGAAEFDDIDNEHEGLTVTQPMSEVELFEFCTGYNVL